METILSWSAWLSAGLIFFLRVSDMTLDTLRVLVMMRGKKSVAWLLGLFQSLIFVLAITSVLNNLDNPLNILGYASGFATGVVVGMLIEERLALGHVQISIVSSRRGAAITERLREEGFAITEIPARGKDGMVSLLNCSVLRKNVRRVQEIVNEVDESAFITAEDVRPVRRGFWRA
ncbi:MAG: hypothetical protein B6D39_07270 [Anaerolineae bacterium UTCFX2]|jgi:uncharacterized protein YebE (UPF0316 family)|nr:DUF2179 domain-containing protein [Anaerolineae bacterium]MCZ7552044.1 DUF5698 domain-containing protein [Anaerolineales bacterium]OQY90948.1 MAG: hypothetical protein B6D39_07270 [Anaerolineae bacterium UTCFX2]